MWELRSFPCPGAWRVGVGLHEKIGRAGGGSPRMGRSGGAPVSTPTWSWWGFVSDQQDRWQEAASQYPGTTALSPMPSSLLFLSLVFLEDSRVEVTWVGGPTSSAEEGVPASLAGGWASMVGRENPRCPVTTEFQIHSRAMFHVSRSLPALLLATSGDTSLPSCSPSMKMTPPLVTASRL